LKATREILSQKLEAQEVAVTEEEVAERTLMKMMKVLIVVLKVTREGVNHMEVEE
jgi:hypothetical protein